jgi:subtilase family serine protease
MTNSVMQSAKPNVRGTWRLLYLLSWLVAIGVIVLLGFTFMQHQRLGDQIAKANTEIARLQSEIDSAQKDTDYVRYAASKSVQASIQWGERGDRLTRIMAVFATLQQVGGSSMRFTNFQLDYSQLSLQGSVSDLKLIYGTNGVVDQFNALDFLEDIKITEYHKSVDGFTFSLSAKVILQHAGDK